MDTHSLIDRYYAAFNASDTEAMIDCLAPDVAHHVNEGQVRTGQDAFPPSVLIWIAATTNASRTSR